MCPGEYNSSMEPSPRQLNKRCLCGSGKAFKNCHGQEFLVKRGPRIPRYSQDEDHFLKPPGYTHVTLAFLYEGEGQPRTDPLGEPGQYEATFTLLQPGQAAERVVETGPTRTFEVQNEKIAGDSHLAMCLPKDARPSPNAEIGLAMPITVGGPDGSAGDVEILLKPSDEGRLAKVFVSLEAENFSEAESRAYFEASALLSNLASKLDIPLRIAHTHLKETESGHVKIGFVRQFGYRGLANLPEFGSASSGFAIDRKGDTHAALTSIYREALNSESPFYQVLCFCRVIQRLTERLRPRWEKAIAEHDKGLLPAYRKYEKMPEAGDEAERFPDAVKGKKFTKVYDDYLRPLRNGIGHVFLEDEKDEDSEERSTDEFEFVDRTYAYLPVAHHIARTMLKNDFGRGGLATLASSLEARAR